MSVFKDVTQLKFNHIMGKCGYGFANLAIKYRHDCDVKYLVIWLPKIK